MMGITGLEAVPAQRLSDYVGGFAAALRIDMSKLASQISQHPELASLAQEAGRDGYVLIEVRVRSATQAEVIAGKDAGAL